VRERVDRDLGQPLGPHLVGGRAHRPDPRAASVHAVITTVTEADLPELLLLMRGYCDFYEVDPSDDALLAMSRMLIDDPELEGVQLIARDDDGEAVGFATIFWTWSTLSASRLAVMNDLFVVADARGGGHADALIAECVERARARGATELAWQTAKDNARAQAVYDRVGATRDERWLDYSLDVAPGATTPDS
jgi:GNAT superfamily N-acetyltransferase